VPALGGVFVGEARGTSDSGADSGSDSAICFTDPMMRPFLRLRRGNSGQSASDGVHLNRRIERQI